MDPSGIVLRLVLSLLLLIGKIKHAVATTRRRTTELTVENFDQYTRKTPFMTRTETKISLLTNDHTQSPQTYTHTKNKDKSPTQIRTKHAHLELIMFKQLALNT